MGKKDDERLFPLPEKGEPVVRVRPPKDRIWTRNKALLIERYLHYFVKVTSHGTYIDGFAAPHDVEHPESWSARRVVESQPDDVVKKRLRHFHLFEVDAKRFKYLQDLHAEFPDKDLVIYRGNFNELVDEILTPTVIPAKEATFALLDQYAFECHWSTLEKLAWYQAGDRAFKIELFYFLPSWWFNRARGHIGTDKAMAWWGAADWADFFEIGGGWDRASVLVARFENELGYDHVKAWPIFTSESGSSIAYFMIHATDHPRAPKLMDEAYHDAQIAPLPVDQLAMQLGLDPSELED